MATSVCGELDLDDLQKDWKAIYSFQPSQEPRPRDAECGAQRRVRPSAAL